MLRAIAGDAARENFSALGYKLLEARNVLVVDVQRLVGAEIARLALRAAIFDRALRFGCHSIVLSLGG